MDRGQKTTELTMPELDERVFYWGTGGGVQDSKVHQELHSPVAVAMRTELTRI